MQRTVFVPRILRLAIALVLSGGVFWGLLFVNIWVSRILLYLSLTLFFLFAQGILQQRRMRRRPEQRREFPNGGWRPGNGGNGGSGVREPRRPYPSTPPARAVALEPDADSVPNG